MAAIAKPKIQLFLFMLFFSEIRLCKGSKFCFRSLYIIWYNRDKKNAGAKGLRSCHKKKRTLMKKSYHFSIYSTTIFAEFTVLPSLTFRIYAPEATCRFFAISTSFDAKKSSFRQQKITILTAKITIFDTRFCPCSAKLSWCCLASRAALQKQNAALFGRNAILRK